MVRIRLQRTGRKNKPSYRIVVADSRSPRDGRFIELIGHFNPLGNKEFNLDEERYNHWISQGAQPSGRVQKLVETN